MGRFVIITTEGECFNPLGEVVYNAQYLGVGFGANKQEAIEDLMNRNPWIADNGFNPAYFLSVKL